MGAGVMVELIVNNYWRVNAISETKQRASNLAIY